jgi:hypothetical protein
MNYTHMLDSEREEHVRRTCERAALDRYVPRRFSTASETGEVPLEEYQFRGVFRERSPDLAELLQHPRLLILAEPGGGKSVVARAAVHLSLEAGRIPILIELKEYRGDLNSLLRTVAPEGLLRDDAARRTYILDGIDEVPTELRSAFARDLDALGHSDPQSTVLATGRQALYVAHRNLFPTLTAVFHILDFADEDIRRYARLSGIPVDDFLQAADRLDIEEQLTNPFALWVLVERFRTTGQLSDRKSEMVSAMIDRLIQSRPRINAHRQRRALCMLGVALEVYSRNEQRRRRRCGSCAPPCESRSRRHASFSMNFTVPFSGAPQTALPSKCVRTANISRRKNWNGRTCAASGNSLSSIPARRTTPG